MVWVWLLSGDSGKNGSSITWSGSCVAGTRTRGLICGWGTSPDGLSGEVKLGRDWRRAVSVRSSSFLFRLFWVGVLSRCSVTSVTEGDGITDGGGLGVLGGWLRESGGFCL